MLTKRNSVIQSYDLTLSNDVGGIDMYHWVEDKKFLGRMKRLCSDIVNQLVQAINNEEKMYVRAYMVGSGAKNLITQNAEEPIDLDYNLEIIECYDFNINNGRAIKEYVQEKFDEILSKNDLDDCGDSKSVLTSGYIEFKTGNKTNFSIDIAIVKQNNNGWDRLIHHKTGFTYLDQYYWNPAPNSRGLSEKANQLKEENCWKEVRDIYLEKKNMYLSRQDQTHTSFIIYIETINEAYNKYCR